MAKDKEPTAEELKKKEEDLAAREKALAEKEAEIKAKEEAEAKRKAEEEKRQKAEQAVKDKAVAAAEEKEKREAREREVKERERAAAMKHLGITEADLDDRPGQHRFVDHGDRIVFHCLKKNSDGTIAGHYQKTAFRKE